MAIASVVAVHPVPLAIFELNRGAVSPDGLHSLTDADLIWPGLRLQLPTTRIDGEAPDDAHEDAKVLIPE